MIATNRGRAEKGSLIDRASDNGATERAEADQALERGDALALHALACQLLDDRAALVRGMDALVNGWSIATHTAKVDPNQEALNALERVATEAISFAREVVRALTGQRVAPTDAGGE